MLLKLNFRKGGLLMNAYLVLGPESTGTRLTTRILMTAGCLGSDQHAQIWDNSPFPPPSQSIVFRRSIPHNKTWPDISKIVQSLREKGYTVQAVVTARDWYATSKSQAKRHVKDQCEAYMNLGKVYPHIFNALSKENVPYTLVTYESIIYNIDSINKLLEYLKLRALEKKELLELNIQNGNKKWYD